jgi:RNA polymerase sigma-70 factor, ECF subfamily
MPSADEALMRLVQRGDRAPFEVLVGRYRAALVRVAASKLGDRAWAEDVVQETFLAVYAARHTYQPDYAFRTWLWTILLRLCHKQRQRQAARPVVTLAEWDREQADRGTSATSQVLAALIDSERSERLHQALADLPEAQADALRLRFFGELSYDDIAVTMHSSVSGAKRRVQLGLERLAERYRRESGEVS